MIRERSDRPLLASLCTVLILVSVLTASDSKAGMSFQGMSFQGMSFQGMSFQGMSFQGASPQGMSFQGMSFQGMSFQGMSFQGMSFQGMSFQGMSFQGMSFQGMSFQGMSFQGMSFQGTSLEGMQLRGVDALRDLGAPLTYDRTEIGSVQVPGFNFQGIQSAVGPITYSPQPTSGATLQAGPGATDTGPGTYVFVPTGGSTGLSLPGTFWNMVFRDATGTEGNVLAFVAAVEKDPHLNSSAAPSNADIYLYTVYYRQPATGQWMSLCPLDPFGNAEAMAVPLDPTDWSAPSRTKFGFACTATGVAAKCARNWGYKPWVVSPVDLSPYYRACLVSARADYCQDDQSFTRDGTLVDLFDSDGINPTVGLPFAPNASGVMFHEEYQASIASHVKDALTTSQYGDLSPSDQALVTRLLRSGLESSRYPDLDPGRACAAAPYIDRCDPEEPYTCYRETNLTSLPYGSSLEVNSPRHCAHSDDTTGDPLDPLCNACTSRVCALDPTCCGDPGPTFYPRTLVWDQRCVDLRHQVCRSNPGGPLWLAGTAAPPPGASPLVTPRGAIGSFEGFVTSGGTTFAEGWACDPDFPSASSPVQVTVGGPLGSTTGTTLFTTTADQPLAGGWGNLAATECGAVGRRGFRFALPAGSAGKDVFVYGIDLNVPGAPFSLLRGGKKTVPGGTAPVNPAAAVWSGWIEPTSSRSYTFCRRLPGTTSTCEPLTEPLNPTATDRYRIWVNGVYEGGNWTDDSSVPDGFTLSPPPSPPAQFLESGVRYPVRIEYQRPAALPTASEMVLLASVDGGTAAPIATSALYALAAGDGAGLAGTYFPGTFTADGLPPDAASGLARTLGTVDNLWTDGAGANPQQATPLPAGLSVEQDFGARFEGQVVPPVSGDYLFSADTDGAVRITVNGQLVTDASHVPPGLAADTCAHDICVTGGAVSRSCEQGNFCAGRVCLTDPSCCAITWDARCAEEVASVCGITCSPTAPISISLAAGKRTDITVEYAHTGGTADKPVRAAKLRLMWTLAGAPRIVVPAQRLYAATAAAALGTGLNAAYFSDPAFATEVLAHVEPQVAFRGDTVPTPTLAAELVCGVTGGPPCGASNVLGAPGLVQAKMGLASGTTVAVTVTGGGAVRGATVALSENGAVLGSAAAQPATGSGGGVFSIPLNLTRGAHKLTATQTAGSVVSAASAALVVNVSESNAPAPPVVSQPAGTVVSGNGQVGVGGTATAGATVTVTATPRDGSAARTTIFTASATGAWTGTLTLPPGDYDVTFTQTVGGATSVAGPSVEARVAIPSLTVTAPADGAGFDGTSGATSVAVAIQGQGAGTSLGPVVVADGDGTFFVDVATLANNGGAFSGTVQLDFGRHVLKIFQRSGGLAGAGVIRTVLVRPPLGALAIKSFVSGLDSTQVPSPPALATVNAASTVVGTGGLVGAGLPGTVVVYEGTARLGEGPIDATGGFAVPVTLTGAGQQSVSVTQSARSLSGGGAAESARATITVRVRPAAPTIDTPATGFEQPGSVVLTVGGLAVPGSTVTVLADGVAQAPTAVAAAAGSATPGRFTTTLTSLTAGTHRLTAFATVDGASGANSAPPVLVSVGDVTPPTVIVAERPIVRPASDESGVVVDFGPLVSASDGGVALPASAITCSPAKSPAPHFPIGSTSVTCIATDAAGNEGATTFVVTVTAADAPLLSGANLIAEAQGPEGAVVNYQISATGYTADCAPPGSGTVQACSAWTPAYQGITSANQVLAQNTNPGADQGALYLLLFGDAALTRSDLFYRLAPGSTQWQQLASVPAQTRATGFVIGAGAPPTLYVPSDSDEVSARGIKISPDGGASWLTALAGTGVAGLAVDPSDPSRLHQLAWRGQPQEFPRTGGPELYETHDGWATFARADQGLPAARVDTIAFDPVNAGRLYASIEPVPGNTVLARLFLRPGTGPWQELSVPPIPAATSGPPQRITIAPTADGCGQPQAFPTVFAGFLLSRTGGQTWEAAPVNGDSGVVFDRSNPCTVYGSDGFRFKKSVDGGRNFTQVGTQVFGLSELIQDASNLQTFYLVDQIMGGFASTDAGQTWSQLPPTSQLQGGHGIGEVAADPVDPNFVLLSRDGAMMRSVDGGSHWVNASAGINQPSSDARHILIDPLQRNRVYAGVERSADGSPLSNGLSTWIKSLDGGQSWTALVNDVGFIAQGAVAVDPLVSGHWFSAETELPGHQLNLRDDAGLGGPAGRLLAPALPAPGSGTLPPPSGILEAIPYAMRILPDAARTVLLWWDRDPAFGAPDVSAFAFREASQTPPALAFEGGGFGRADVFYDRSDGVDRLFVDGGAIGKTPNVLYRTTVEAARRGPASAAAWEALGGDDRLRNFKHLVVDPGSSGQAMYTIGDFGLFESHDGGKSWVADASAPPSPSAVWVSRADGALFATISLSSGGWPVANSLSRGVPGLLWKRTPATGVPVGARLFKGDLRVSCTSGGATDPRDGLPARATAAGSTFPLGATVLTCTAKDAFGNVGTAALTITVRDTTPPAITLDVPPAPATAPAGGTAAVTFSVSATDAVDGARPVSCVPASGSAFPIGITTVTCTAADGRTPANVATASFPVTVSQQGGPALAAPTLAGPTAPVEATGPGGAPLVVTAATAAGASLQPLCTPGVGTLVPIGTAVVSCSATDPASGLVVLRTFTVVVRDTTAPAITLPGDLAVAAKGAFGAHVSYAASASDVVDGGGLPVSCAPASGAVFPLGATVVACRAVDKAGNQAFAHFKVTVTDQSQAILHLTDMTVDANDATGARVTYSPPPSATDLSGNQLAIDCLPPSGTLLPVGDTSVACTAAAGTSHEARGSFLVHVVDQSPPIVTAPGTITVEASGPSGALVAFTATASDLVDGTLVPVCRRTSGFGLPTLVASGALFPLGGSVVTCSATDGAGNVGSASLAVVVVDTTPPVLTLPGPITVPGDAAATADVTFSVGAVDTVSGNVDVACSASSGDRFVAGMTTITCVARDAAGNESHGSFTVTVNANRPPAVKVPANIVKEATSAAGAIVTFTVTANDPEDGVVTASCTPASGTTFPVAVTTVTCRATDSAGATTTATFTVTVRDTSGPVLTVPPDLTITTCASPSIGTATATDAAGSPVTITSNKPTTFLLGTTVVTYTARDARVNVTTGTQRVTAILGNDKSCCPAGTNIITGTPNNDTLTGTSGRDCILGLGGQDHINGGGGDDFISGGDGDDIIDGGAGNDQIWGGAGQDQITGGDGNDVIDGGDGDDVIRGGTGNDILHGGAGQDQLFGENDDDQLFGDDGDDRLDGGPGNDSLNGGAGNDTCTGSTGTNTISLCSP